MHVRSNCSSFVHGPPKNLYKPEFWKAQPFLAPFLDYWIFIDLVKDFVFEYCSNWLPTNLSHSAYGRYRQLLYLCSSGPSRGSEVWTSALALPVAEPRGLAEHTSSGRAAPFFARRAILKHFFNFLFIYVYPRGKICVSKRTSSVLWIWGLEEM